MCVRVCVCACVRVCVRATYVWTCLLGCILLCVYLSLPFGYRRRNVIFPITISNVLVFQGRRVAKSRHWGKKSWHLTGWFWDPNSTFRNRMPTFMHLHNETNRVYWWESKERKSLQSRYGKGSCMKTKCCEMMWNVKSQKKTWLTNKDICNTDLVHSMLRLSSNYRHVPHSAK